MCIYIIWFIDDGEELYTFIEAADESDAERMFHLYHSGEITELREVDLTDNRYWAYI